MRYKDYSELIKEYIGMLATGTDNLLVIVSPAGYGKTTLVLNAMEQYKNGYHYINGYISPMEFYLTLYKTIRLRQPKFLILDDVEYSLQDKKIQVLLKGATTEMGLTGKRIVHYASNSSRVVGQPKIEFDGKIILLLNQLPKENKQVRAILDRAIFLQLFMTQEEIMKSIEKEIIPKPYKSLTIEERTKVFDFLREKAPGLENISFRSIVHGLKCFEYCKQSKKDWKPLFDTILSNQIN